MTVSWSLEAVPSAAIIDRCFKATDRERGPEAASLRSPVIVPCHAVDHKSRQGPLVRHRRVRGALVSFLRRRSRSTTAGTRAASTATGRSRKCCCTRDACITPPLVLMKMLDVLQAQIWDAWHCRLEAGWDTTCRLRRKASWSAGGTIVTKCLGE